MILHVFLYVVRVCAKTNFISRNRCMCMYVSPSLLAVVNPACDELSWEDEVRQRNTRSSEEIMDPKE